MIQKIWFNKFTKQRSRSCDSQTVRIEPDSIGAGTGPAGPAMAGPFSAEVET